MQFMMLCLKLPLVVCILRRPVCWWKGQHLQRVEGKLTSSNVFLCISYPSALAVCVCLCVTVVELVTWAVCSIPPHGVKAVLELRWSHLHLLC